MNSSNDFLKTELKLIFLTLDGVEIRYEFRKSSQTHIVEVKPKSVFRNSAKYIEMEMELDKKFVELFPDEELLFISNDSLTKITSPEIIYKQKINYEEILVSNSAILVKNENKTYTNKYSNFPLAA